jgi:DNA-3-methyladenine glycosylase
MYLINNKKIKTKILPRAFYLNDDVVEMSKLLLGKVLVSEFNGQRSSGVIIETEAYDGLIDKACHAYNNRFTPRTKILYEKGGVAYIYLCYGIHHLFNIVVGNQGTPKGVLIRALEPLEGTDVMLKRRKMTQLTARLTAGPGSLSQALGITTKWRGHVLTHKPIWLEDWGITIKKKDILASARIGIDYAQEHKDLPWRFRVKTTPRT